MVATRAKDEIVYSYLALRKAVGIVALGLPFAVTILGWVFGNHVEASISGYYYTGARNVFVGSLCAIGMFQLCCRGYDWRDEVAGIFSAVCAIGVAFFPTAPDACATPRQAQISYAHYTAALLLFLTLAVFCLFLFRKSSAKDPKDMTPKKRRRNLVYIICGVAILASLALIAVFKLLIKQTYLVGNIGMVFVFETTSLWAFGVAWLIKGETFLKDENTTQPGT